MRTVKEIKANPEPGNTRFIVRYRHPNDSGDTLVFWDNGKFLQVGPGEMPFRHDINEVLHEDTGFMEQLRNLLEQAI